jgi:hypothetical protein
VEWRLWQFATRYPEFGALARAVNGFQRYIDRNSYMIPTTVLAGVLVR